ncbi:cold-shock protein [Streptomyces piniterrae]|uniref:Cold-shock protein n=1 Tax=Streptomyces piniterrae TaxID=2571125 RepID=A0A4U0NKF9_9ACTN|nr:cold shock domain-containing protein [Streptomyces piniterrae]TJZ50424.1 cold-shock protein [Streptomyces piniterrae]
MPNGIVKWFDSGRGVGVIAQDGAGREVVAYWSAIQGDQDRRLIEGERVLFNVTQDAAGIRADNIHRLPAG